MTWDEAMDRVDKIVFPTSIDSFIDKSGTESHLVGKEYHGLKTYYRLSKLDQYELVLKYNVCPTCKANRNQSATVYDGLNSLSYQKVFISHGEKVIN